MDDFLDAVNLKKCVGIDVSGNAVHVKRQGRVKAQVAEIPVGASMRR
jgi:hypothetical protein